MKPHDMSIRESAASDVPESSNYTTVYQLNIPVDGKFNDEAIPYSIDESENISKFQLTVNEE